MAQRDVTDVDVNRVERNKPDYWTKIEHYEVMTNFKPMKNVVI